MHPTRSARGSRTIPRPRDSHARRRGVRAVAVTLFLVAFANLVGAQDPTQVRRVLALLRGVEQEYREAFDENGALVRPMELEEAKLLLAEARTLQRMGGTIPADLGQRLAALTAAVESRAPVDAVAAQVGEIRGTLRTATGVSEEMLPAELPAASRGKALYTVNCASCHGERGTGDGPDAQRLERRPPDFTDMVFMREETPADFFLVISLGRRLTAMAAWGDALSVQDRWDLISYLWALRSSFRAGLEGQRLFITHCAGCHATAAAGLDAEQSAAPKGALTDIERTGAQSDAEIYTAVTDGIAGKGMPGFRSTLSDEERWKVVAFVRALTLGDSASVGEGPSAAAVGGEQPYLEQAVSRVQRAVAAALDAYRLHQDDAPDLAATAYLAFEPLEPSIAGRDPQAVSRVEAQFVRLQKALRQPGALREVELATAAVADALEATKTRSPGAPEAHRKAGGMIAALVTAAGLAGFLYVSWRRRSRAPVRSSG